MGKNLIFLKSLFDNLVQESRLKIIWTQIKKWPEAQKSRIFTQ